MKFPILHHATFLFYLKAVALVLLLSGVILCVLSFLLKKNVKPIWVTWGGWLCMAPLFFLSIVLGKFALVPFITILGILGIKEFARATGLYQDWCLTGVVYLGTIGLGILCMVRNPVLGNQGWYGLYVVFPVYVIAAILVVPILRNRVKGQLQAVSLSILAFTYIGWMFGHLALLTTSENAMGYLLYLVFAVEINDVAAFTFGKLLGRHPLRSAISPKKTWEGSLGALGVSMILPWLLRFSFPYFEPLQLVLTGLIVGVGGQLGDLSISVIKRDIGIKDMGATIPGHGGILDRIDSLIYVSPLFLHMVRFFEMF